MPSEKLQKEAEPVSEFIRELITRWEQSGKLLKDLAAESGMAKSMPSQIKARTSDATLYSARKLAKPLGYADLPDLVNAAWAWWYSDRKSLPTSAPEAPRTEAIRLAESYGVSREQIDRVLERWPLAEFGDKDALWWLARFHEERTIDAERTGHVRAEKSAAASREKVTKRKQAQVREIQDRKAAQTPSPAPHPVTKKRAG